MAGLLTPPTPVASTRDAASALIGMRRTLARYSPGGSGTVVAFRIIGLALAVATLLCGLIRFEEPSRSVDLVAALMLGWLIGWVMGPILWLLVVAPVMVALTVSLTAFSGQGWAWPWVLATLPAMLGATAGLGVLLSVTRPVRQKDPNRRTGPFDAGDDPNAAGALIASSTCRWCWRRWPPCPPPPWSCSAASGPAAAGRAAWPGTPHGRWRPRHRHRLLPPVPGHPLRRRAHDPQAGPASASIVAVGTTPSTWRTSSVSRVTNASACSWVSAMYSAS
jgi:hypothetical protein